MKPLNRPLIVVASAILAWHLAFPTVASGQAQITQPDIVPPEVIVPARLIVPCNQPGGAVVEYSVSIQDNLDPNPEASCIPASGSFFPSGTNTVTCIAMDRSGNRTTKQFQVIVGFGCGSNQCLTLTTPADLTAPCTSPAGAVVTYAVTARNSCTGAPLPVTCTPPSGSTFPIGITRVVCTVNSGAVQGAKAFLVEVTDTQPPQINCPSNIVVTALSPLGAVVDYEVTAVDDCSPQPRIRCSPPSGGVFPVGDTRVSCEASDDSGNLSTCAFVVTVLPARPFTVSQVPSGGVELRWTGDAEVEATVILGRLERWIPQLGTPEMDGEEWVLRLPASSRARFFRLRLAPVAPPPDRDMDGVPDDVDQCPDSLAGIPVDETGCATFDLLVTPELALGPEVRRLEKLRTELRRWPSTQGFVEFLPGPGDPGTLLVDFLMEREFSTAIEEAASMVDALNAALTELVRLRIARLAEINSSGPVLDEESADVRNEDHELMDLLRFEESLTESLWRHQEVLLNVSNVVRAIETTQVRERVQIQSIDTARGIAVLTDGRHLILPKPRSAGVQSLASIQDAIAEDSLVDVTVSTLPDGSSFGLSATSALNFSDLVVQQINLRRLDLRITPVDFGLPNFDLAPRHRLKAYKWGFTDNLSRHYFEYGQAFAAIRFVSTGSGGNYKHWLKIDHDTNKDGFYATLVSKMDETTPPFVLKQTDLPEFTAFNIRVREYRAPITGPNTGVPEMVHEEFHVIEVNQTGFYAEAFYDQTSFDLQDSPSETGHRIARVTDFARRFPLTLKPQNEFEFSASSFKPSGNGSTYPTILPVKLNEPFAVHFQDPNELSFFSNPDDLDKGLYGPRLRGVNHGYAFEYRVELPFIARDRLHDCPGSQPDTFYRIPLAAGYSVSQGNNGQFTHNGWQRFAWDFPRPANSAVLAARGGRVVDMRESSTQSCWNPNAPNPNGGTGACVNCMGNATANFVFIRHRDGSFAWYGHFRNNSVSVSLNQRVYRGTPLGGVGTTGCSTGNHLHFHVVDPDQTTTIPVRFESFTLPIPNFVPCYLPPSNSIGLSTNQ